MNFDSVPVTIQFPMTFNVTPLDVFILSFCVILYCLKAQHP